MSLVPPEFLPPRTLPAGRLQALGGLVTPYEATLTASTSNPTLGSGSSQNGWWTQHGGWACVVFYIQFGSSGASAGTGTYRIALPPEAPLNGLYVGRRAALGVVTLLDNSAPTSRQAQIIGETSNMTRVNMREPGTGSFVNDSSPWGTGWANNDYLAGQLSYIYEPA